MEIKKILDASELAKKTNLNAKITEIESKTPSITGLAANSALTAVENKIPNVSILVKKTHYNTKICKTEKKITDHNHDKYITNPEFNNLAAGIFTARLARANLVTKTDFDTKLQELNKKLIQIKQNICLFKKKSISSWKSKGLSDEVIKSPTRNNNSLAPNLEYFDKKMSLKFDGNCLIKLDKFTFNEETVNIYIVYDLDSNLNNFDPTLENCLFGAVKLTKNNDVEKYQYSGYGTGFYSRGTFSHPTGSFGQNALNFGADMSSSAHATNRANRILILGKSLTQGIGNTLCRKNVFN